MVKFTDIKNVEYETNESLTSDKLKSYINAFEHTPYSKKWWKEYRFKSKLIQNDSTLEKSSYKNNIWTSLLDKNGNVLTHKIEQEDCYTWGSGYHRDSWGINIKNSENQNSKVINWCNILTDKEINIPIQFVNYPDYWNYSKGYLSLIDECIILNSIDRVKTREKWPEIKNYIENNSENRPMEFDKCYDCVCDDYKFNLTDFLYKGFIFGTYGNFSINKIYKLATLNE